MSREQIVQRIRQHNPHAAPRFLESFDDGALRLYLDRLTRLDGQRGPRSVWVRDTTDTAIVMRKCA